MPHRWIYSPLEVGVVRVGSPNSPLSIAHPFPVPFRIGPHFLLVSFWAVCFVVHPGLSSNISWGVSHPHSIHSFLPLFCECPSSHFLRSDFSPLIPSFVFGNCTRVHPLVLQVCGFPFISFTLLLPFSFCSEAFFSASQL